jgi:tripartite-type tricarboxylate transporter receptor subunit TctC
MNRSFSMLLIAIVWTSFDPSITRVHAQSKYPDRTIKLIIPFPAGGLFDNVGRPLAEKLKPLLGTVVIENIGGAGSSRGALVAARAEPDGHTLFLAGNGSHVVVPLAASKPPYDPVKDFEPISLLGTVGLAITVHPSQPMKALPELVEYIQKNPGKLSFGNAGTGSLTHLTGEMFKLQASAPGIVHLPYTGGVQVVNDLVGGHVPVGVVTLTSQFLELHASGKIRMLAVTTPSRLAIAPDLPTATETIPGMISQNFAGVFAPKGTSKVIIEQVAAAVSKVMLDPDVQRLYSAGGFDPQLQNSPEVLRRFLDDELAKWRPVIAASGFHIK